MCQRLSPEELEELDQHIPRQSECARRGELGGLTRADAAFHSRIADLCNSTLLAEQFECVAYRSRQIVSHAVRVTPDRKDYDKTRGVRTTDRRHRQVVRALRSRGAEHAEDVFRACFADSRERLLGRLRASTDKGGAGSFDRRMAIRGLVELHEPDADGELAIGLKAWVGRELTVDTGRAW